MTPWDQPIFSFCIHPLSKIYGAAVRIRNRQYDTGEKERVRLDAKVISVGNLTVGGTGKTPLVESVSRLALEQNGKVAILSRGYGRTSQRLTVVSDGSSIRCGVDEAGDEPLMLAKRIPEAVVIVNADRAAAGREAIRMGCHTLVLDDGFQHRRLARDLDLVVLDGRHPFGNGKLLPAGPLREPPESLRRAHAVILTRSSDEDYANALESIRPFTQAPVLRSRHQPCSWRDSSGSEYPLSHLSGKRAVVFSGIGSPGSFESTVSRLGVKIMKSVRFRDHHRYSASEIQALTQAARSASAEVLMTTEKDAQKIKPEWSDWPIFYLSIALEFLPDEGGLRQLIAGLWK
jgi:tetraacyldisaccharide 4'-kinase